MPCLYSSFRSIGLSTDSKSKSIPSIETLQQYQPSSSRLSRLSDEDRANHLRRPRRNSSTSISVHLFLSGQLSIRSRSVNTDCQSQIVTATNLCVCVDWAGCSHLSAELELTPESVRRRSLQLMMNGIWQKRFWKTRHRDLIEKSSKVRHN